MTVIVTGSRDCDWRDWPGIKAALEAAKPTLVVQGGCAGADALAVRWAAANDIPCETIVANWASGRRAGPERNARMLSYFPDALVIAFPKGESRGTRGCVAMACKRGMQVLVLETPVRERLRSWAPTEGV